MGIRAGQGYGVAKPKRAQCPDCGKHGVTGWKASPSGLYRHCQYCQQAWGEAGWALAMGTPSEGRAPLPTAAPMSPRLAIRTQVTELMGRYWGLAYREGKEDVNLADDANQVLDELGNALTRLEQVSRAVPAAVFDKLQQLQVGGCTCLTKTPELQFHAPGCRYRLAREIGLLLSAPASADHEASPEDAHERKS